MIQLGVDRLLTDLHLQKRLKGKRLGFLGHPASVTGKMTHSLDELCLLKNLQITSAFGPQHGMRGEKQDNMIESENYIDPVQKIPVWSLYGQVRRPTPAMWDTFDVLLVDLQDVGCRIYTFLTTLFYLLEDMAKIKGKSLWVLDRPNPAGRPLEGHKLNMEFASFVGAAPIPMRHGLTLGEAALWYREHRHLNIDLEVISMSHYHPSLGPGFGWPVGELSWVNPSPNMPQLSTARSYAGTVLLEGTHLSEGRGTTRPLEFFGAPSLNSIKIIESLHHQFANWMQGCKLRPAFFEPTFHKFKGEMVSAIQIHVDGPFYHHELFKPYRLLSAYLKVVHQLYPELNLWTLPPYEYENHHLPIDILSGDSRLREWVMEKDSTAKDLENIMLPDEKSWLEERRPFLLYE